MPKKFDDGVKRLQRKMQRIASLEKDEVDRAMLQGAGIIAGEAQRRVTGGGKSTTMLNVRTGRLRRGIRPHKVSHLHVAVTTSRVVYAPIHEFGGKAGRGHRVTIPARPYMGPAFEAKKDDVFTLIRKVYSGPLHVRATF